MNADLLFNNVEFFGAPSGQRVRVKQGETFTVNLNDAGDGIVWATTEDPILDVLDNGATCGVKAHSQGNAEIQIQRDRQVVFYLVIEVFNPDEATGFVVPPPTVSQA